MKALGLQIPVDLITNHFNKFMKSEYIKNFSNKNEHDNIIENIVKINYKDDSIYHLTSYDISLFYDDLINVAIKSSKQIWKDLANNIGKILKKKVTTIYKLYCPDNSEFRSSTILYQFAGAGFGYTMDSLDIYCNNGTVIKSKKNNHLDYQIPMYIYIGERCFNGLIIECDTSNIINKIAKKPTKKYYTFMLKPKTNEDDEMIYEEHICEPNTILELFAPYIQDPNEIILNNNINIDYNVPIKDLLIQYCYYNSKKLNIETIYKKGDAN